jgi:hypothetical protein
MTIISLIGMGGGLLGKLFGAGKGKEIPQESAAVTAARDQYLNYLMGNMKSAPQRRTQAMQGMKMPSRTRYMNDPMNMLWSSYFGKGFSPSINQGYMNPFDVLYGGQGKGNPLAAMTNPGMPGGMGGMGGFMPQFGPFSFGGGGMGGMRGGNPWARFSMPGRPYMPMGR